MSFLSACSALFHQPKTMTKPKLMLCCSSEEPDDDDDDDDDDEPSRDVEETEQIFYEKNALSYYRSGSTGGGVQPLTVSQLFLRLQLLFSLLGLGLNLCFIDLPSLF